MKRHYSIINFSGNRGFRKKLQGIIYVSIVLSFMVQWGMTEEQKCNDEILARSESECKAILKTLQALETNADLLLHEKKYIKAIENLETAQNLIESFHVSGYENWKIEDIVNELAFLNKYEMLAYLMTRTDLLNARLSAAKAVADSMAIPSEDLPKFQEYYANGLKYNDFEPLIEYVMQRIQHSGILIKSGDFSYSIESESSKNMCSNEDTLREDNLLSRTKNMIQEFHQFEKALYAKNYIFIEQLGAGQILMVINTSPEGSYWFLVQESNPDHNKYIGLGFPEMSNVS